MASDGLVRVDPSRAHSFVTSVLSSQGVPQDRARMVADSLVLADLRGVDTHGVNRLSGYTDRIKHKVLEPNPDLEIIMKTPVLAHLDAQNTFGFVAGCLAIDKAIEMASVYGVGIVAVKNSNHYGMAATYILRAVERGYGAFAFTNASRSMPAWGSKEPLLGTSPLAVGLPGGANGHFILDMSPSVAARGKIRKAARRGEPIPEGYAIDEEGRPTTDAEAALKGSVLPIGGPKGSGLAMMMDIFGGLMTGSSFAGNVNDQYKNLSEPQRVGHWFMVFRPEAFLDSWDEYTDKMDVLLDSVRTSDKAMGIERILTPGENASEKEAERRASGIPYTKGELEALHNLAKDCGLPVTLV